MYSLLHQVGLRKALSAEVPSLFLSILVAEMFYKFHSFTLECLAFMATWFVFSYVLSLARNAWSARRA